MAKVTITQEVNGEVVDTAIANLPDAALELAVDAIAAAYGYTETVPNPDFDSSQEASEANPETIPNPLGATKYRHFAYQLRMFAVDHAKAYAAKQAAEAAAAQAQAQADALAGQVTVE